MGEDITDLEDENDGSRKPAPKVLESVSKRIQLKSRGRVFGVVRENYLREDIPCRSQLCFEDCAHKYEDRDTESRNRQSLLPSEVTHYLIPATDTVNTFMEVLELEEITGVIFVQTVVNSIQQHSLRHYRRVCSFVRDQKNASVFFPNEFFKPTFVQRDNSESVQEWQQRMVFQVGCWYYDHLGGQRPMVILTEDDVVIKKFSTQKVEVFVMSMRQYLDMFWSHLTAAKELFKALEFAAANPAEDRTKEYFEYFKPEALESGLKTGKFVSGRLNVNKHLAQTEAFVTRGSSHESSGGKSDSDILISGNGDRNRAVDGDLVVVEILPKGEWRSRASRLVDNVDTDKEKDEGQSWSRGADVMTTGRVVGVLQRGWGSYIATLPREDEDSLDKAAGKRVLVIPYNRKIPKIRILTTQYRSLQGHRIRVRIDAWPVTSQYPQGHFVSVVGRTGDLETEIDTILTENDITVTPFSQGILQELPSLDSCATWRPDPQEVARRRDLRDTLVMSIDPIGCEDVDDALSVRKLENGNLEVGVHIADVTHFVPVNSLTDQEARKRATTVYLADRRYDMLPPVLSAQLCSLLGGVERYAVSCVWELHPATFKVRRCWYGRTVIRSSYKLCYEHAQDIVNGKSAQQMSEVIPELSGYSGARLEEKFGEMKEALDNLSVIAKKWQNTRQKEGALNLESTEVQFEFEEKSMKDLKPKEHLEIHETVAECMIMANHWVARKISASFATNSILRLHPPPKRDKFEELQQCAAARGWVVDTKCNKTLADSLDKCVDSGDWTVNFLLRNIATSAMEQAQYFSTGSVKQERWSHYGLALGQYTHFTSPIRRYADILVHRLLMAALALDSATPTTSDGWWSDSHAATDTGTALPSSSSPGQQLGNSELQELCEHINTRNRAAQRAQRDSQILFQTLYFKDRPLSDPRCVVDAVIFSLRDNGVLVYIPQYAIKGPVYLESKEKEVLFCGKLGPTWQRGVVTKKETFVKVETLEGTNKYKLFDHVTVGIQLRGNDAHANVLSLSLLDNRPWKEDTNDSQQKQVNFLKEAKLEKSGSQNIEEDAEEDVVPENVDEKHHKRRKAKVNAYQFFQEMEQLGLRPLN